jgi:hypothetical protein
MNSVTVSRQGRLGGALVDRGSSAYPTKIEFSGLS